MKDFWLKLDHFAAWVATGLLLSTSLTACMTPKEAKRTEDTIHWFADFLPAPFGGIADSFAPVIGTLLAVKGTKHASRHLAKRREARKARHGSPPQP